MTTDSLTGLNLDDMDRLAQRLVSAIAPGDVILLIGDLGAGKTQFAKFLINAASTIHTEVPSPTFTLVQTYDTAKGEIWHFDLYRIEDEAEIEATGWDEALSHGISIVEWPDRLGRYLPKTRLEIHITIADDDSRTVSLLPIGATWQNRAIPLTKEKL
jgi:tRNA threonylcarbamoyl adenosine modification protein YjeE